MRIFTDSLQRILTSRVFLRLLGSVAPWASCALLAVSSLGVMGGKAERSEIPVWWSPSLQLASLKDIPQKLQEPVDMGSNPPGIELRNAEQQTVRVFTCSQYLETIGHGFFASTSYDEAVEGAFVDRCYLLRDLQHIKPAMRSYVRRKWSPHALSELPPLFLVGDSSLWEKIEKARATGASWQSFEPALRVRKYSDDPFILCADDGGEDAKAKRATDVCLQILARGDFNGDGVEDLAVSVSVHPRDGTLYANFYCILTRDRKDKRMRLLTVGDAPYRMLH